MSKYRFPTEVIQLPSQGKVYPEGHPLRENGGKLDVKYMTAKEEDILTNTNLLTSGLVIDKLLESLVIHDGVSYADLSTGDLNAVLMASRILAYGKEYSVILTCGKCKQSSEHIIDLSELETPDEVVDTDENGCYEIETPTGLKIVLKTMTRGEEKKIEKALEKMESVVAGSTGEVTARLKKVIVSINGVTDKTELSTMVDNLIVRDSKYVRDQFQKINPSVDMSVSVPCSCGHDIEGDLPIGVTFLWPDARV